MKHVSVLILCFAATLVACDYECFRDTADKCKRKWMAEDDGDYDFCNTEPNMTRCDLEAAVKCNTGFSKEAEKLLFYQTDACTEGTATNEAVKRDKNCGFYTWEKTRYCDFEQSELCTNFHKARECIGWMFSKCSQDTRKAFYDIFNSFGDLQARKCKLERDRYGYDYSNEGEE